MERERSQMGAIAHGCERSICSLADISKTGREGSSVGGCAAHATHLVHGGEDLPARPFENKPGVSRSALLKPFGLENSFRCYPNSATKSSRQTLFSLLLVFFICNCIYCMIALHAVGSSSLRYELHIIYYEIFFLPKCVTPTRW